MIGKWLEGQIAKRGLKKTDVAEALGLTPSKLSNVLGGKRALQAGEIEPLAGLLGVEARDILTLIKGGKQPAAKASALPAPTPRDGFEFAGATYARVPVFDVAVSAGPGSLTDEVQRPLAYDFFRLDQLAQLTRTSPDNLALVKVRGDSMEPALRNGDMIIVDMSQTSPANAGLFVLALGHEVFVKRLQLSLETRRVRVISDNPRYETEEIEESELTIIGRVVWGGGAKG